MYYYCTFSNTTANLTQMYHEINFIIAVYIMTSKYIPQFHLFCLMVCLVCNIQYAAGSSLDICDLLFPYTNHNQTTTLSINTEQTRIQVPNFVSNFLMCYKDRLCCQLSV